MPNFRPSEEGNEPQLSEPQLPPIPVPASPVDDSSDDSTMGYGGEGLELPSLPPLVGMRFGHVRIDSLIDRGGMGEVYKGFDETLERKVAVKAIRPEQRPSPEARTRFLREAKLLSKLEHPNVCQIYDLHQDDGEAGDLLILELVEGRKLGEVLSRGLGFEQKLRIAEQIASALVAAHDRHIVHRDLKPGNVMVTRDGKVKVLDFGLARSLDSNEPGSSPEMAGLPFRDSSALPRLDTSLDGHTNQKFMVGTLAFMSPEQAVGEKLTEASDMYSLGLLLQWLFTEASPFGEETSKLDLLRRVLQGDTVAPQTEDPHLSLLIEELKRTNPTQRPGAAECLRRLQDIAGKPARKRVRRTLWTAVGLVSLLAGTIFWFHQRMAEKRAELTLAYTQEAKDIEWLMRIGHSLPLQELTHHTADVRRRMGAMRGLMQQNGNVASGPGNFALGRSHLALGEIFKAEEHLAAAWETPYRRPEVGFAYAVVRARSWESARAESAMIEDPGWAEYRHVWMDRHFRRGTSELLRAAKGLGGVPRLTEALEALFESRWEQATEGLLWVRERYPWLYEVSAWLGELHWHQAMAAAREDRPQAARDELLVAAGYFSEALNVGSSDARLHLSLCRLWHQALAFQVAGVLGDEMPVWNVDELHRAGSGACERAFKVDPQLAEARLELARGLGLRAVDAESDGRLEDALDWIVQGIREAPDSSVEGVGPATLRWQSWANGRLARWRAASGLDSIQSLLAAVEQAQKANRVEPHDPGGTWLQIDGLRSLADHQRRLGEDPVIAYRQMEAVLKRTVKRDWVYPQSYLELARFYLDRAEYEASEGLEVEDSLSLAGSSLSKARNLDSDSELIAPVEERLEMLSARLGTGEPSS